MKHRDSRRAGRALCVLAFAGAAALPHAALAQMAAADYNVWHRFTFLPPAGTTVPSTVTGYFFTHAWVKEGVPPFGVWEDEDHAPLVQQPGFDGLGVDMSVGVGAVNLPRAGGSVPIMLGSFPIPDTGLAVTGCSTMIGPNTGSSAVGCVEFDVQPYGVGTPIDVLIRSQGGGIALGHASIIYAFSTAAIRIEGRSPTGTIVWGPHMEAVSGSAGAMAIRKDPIIVTVTDVGGNVASATVLDIGFHDHAGVGRFSWDNGSFFTNTPTARFYIRMDPAVVRNPGDVSLAIENGVVTVSHATGPFAGLLPPVGTPIPLNFPFPNLIPIDVDAGGLVPLPVDHVGWDFGGGADSPAATPKCCIDYNGDEEIDFSDIEGFLAAYAAQIPGSCAPGADLNGDEEFDFSDVERFLALYAAGC